MPVMTREVARGVVTGPSVYCAYWSAECSEHGKAAGVAAMRADARDDEHPEGGARALCANHLVGFQVIGRLLYVDEWLV